MNYKALKERIKTKYGTIENFAKENKQTTKYVEKVLSGEINPEITTLYKWIDTLHISVNNIPAYFFMPA